MIAGLLVLVLFQLAGELLVAALALPVPGAVVGMLLLLLSLRWLAPVWPARWLTATEQASTGLINNLSLFFLPAGVGIFFLPEAINAQWPALLAAMVGGTFISMLLSGWLIRALARGKLHG